MTWIIGIVLAVVAIFAFVVLAWWGLPIAAVLGVLALVYVLQSRKSRGPAAGTIETGRRTEPTGTPRKAAGGAETANERVGQA
jgi:hypothetical protein